MPHAIKRSILWLGIATVIFDAHADIGKIGGGIGGIGSPVVVTNVPKAPPKEVTPPVDADADSPSNYKNVPTTLIDIAFNQNRVNFKPALSEAVTETEKNTPGTIYKVASVIPLNTSNSSQATRLRGTYDDNLNAVVQQMVSLGVNANRIRTTTQVEENATSQDVIITGMAQ